MAGGAAGTRWLVAGWSAVYGWLYLNAAVGVETYVSATVPAVAVLAGWTAWRAGRAKVEVLDVPVREDVRDEMVLEPRRVAA